eukprot:2194851-Rhodomonas_salina.4
MALVSTGHRRVLYYLELLVELEGPSHGPRIVPDTQPELHQTRTHPMRFLGGQVPGCPPPARV